MAEVVVSIIHVHCAPCGSLSLAMCNCTSGDNHMFCNKTNVYKSLLTTYNLEEGGSEQYQWDLLISCPLYSFYFSLFSACLILLTISFHPCCSHAQVFLQCYSAKHKLCIIIASLGIE